MKWIIIGLSLFVFSFNGCTQSKGAVPLSTSKFKISPSTTTHAIVIGISDYQDKNIPDLQFADRDALEFAKWLESPAGGSVPSDNIQLFINEHATIHALEFALFQLVKICKEGDQVLIYFSGHGDVVTMTISQPSYLLAYDTPSSVYMSSAIKLVDLQDIISTLTENNKCSVLLITDACHAGKIGNNVSGGAQITNANLSKLFSSEVKILSCQATEYAQEGKQWGGGRGAFSYHLVEGLSGLADQNNDGKISLVEIDRYLGDKVTLETNNLQTPITVGDRNAIIARVDLPTLLALNEARKHRVLTLETIGSRGIEEEILAKLDSNTRSMYYSFKAFIVKHILVEPKDSCAWTFFQVLEKNQTLSPLHQIMRNNLAVAFLDEVQQALNAVMNDDPYELNTWRSNASKYNHYPDYLQKCLELIGTDHPLYKSIMSKKLFFEAYNLVHHSGEGYRYYPDSIKNLARNLLRKALSYEKNPFNYYLLGNTYLYNFTIDSCSLNYQRAMALAPNWKLPYAEMAWYFMDTHFDLLESAKWINKGLAIDSNAYNLLEMKAWLHQRYNQIDSIEFLCNRMRKLRPNLINDYFTLACTYALINRQYDKAMDFWNKCNWRNEEGDWLRSYIYLNTRRIDKVNKRMISLPLVGLAGYEIGGQNQLNELNNINLNKLYSQLLAKEDSNIITSNYLRLGMIKILLHQYDTAEALIRSVYDLLRGGEVGHDQVLANAYLGLIYQMRKDFKTSEIYFKKAFDIKTVLYTYQAKAGLSEAHFFYGIFLSDLNRFQEAEKQFHIINTSDYGCCLGFYGMAIVMAKQGKDKEALDWLEKALDWYFPRKEPILEEPAFGSIKKTKRFREMIRKNFE